MVRDTRGPWPSRPGMSSFARAAVSARRVNTGAHLATVLRRTRGYRLEDRSEHRRQSRLPHATRPAVGLLCAQHRLCGPRPDRRGPHTAERDPRHGDRAASRSDLNGGGGGHEGEITVAAGNLQEGRTGAPGGSPGTPHCRSRISSGPMAVLRYVWKKSAAATSTSPATCATIVNSASSGHHHHRVLGRRDRRGRDCRQSSRACGWADGRSAASPPPRNERAVSHYARLLDLSAAGSWTRGRRHRQPPRM